MTRQADVLKGTLDLMILKGLSFGPSHGYSLAKWIHTCTDGTLDIDDGALYPALHRLELRGFVDAEWGASEHNRRAKYYQLTPKGRAQLREEVRSWERFAAAMSRILSAPAGA